MRSLLKLIEELTVLEKILVNNSRNLTLNLIKETEPEYSLSILKTEVFICISPNIRIQGGCYLHQ